MIFLNKYSVELRSDELHSVELHSNSNIHSCNTIPIQKKIVKKEYSGNESLSLAWDHIKLSWMPLFSTTTVLVQALV